MKGVGCVCCGCVLGTGLLVESPGPEEPNLPESEGKELGRRGSVATSTPCCSHLAWSVCLLAMLAPPLLAPNWLPGS